jgi:hypothetical protein
MSSRRFHLFFTAATAIFIIIAGITVSFFSWENRMQQLLQSLEGTRSWISREYSEVISNFWQVYMPVFEDSSGVYSIIQNYFSDTSDNRELNDISPFDKQYVTAALSQMMIRNPAIRWIGLYSPHRKQNYYLVNGGASLISFDENFPYSNKLKNKTSRMEIYGAAIIGGNFGERTFAISGGIPQKATASQNGAIFAGYSVSGLEQIAASQSSGLESVFFFLHSSGNIIFNSWGDYSTEDYSAALDPHYYISTEYTGNGTTLAGYAVSEQEIVIASHEGTPLILSVSLICLLITFLLSAIADWNYKINSMAAKFTLKQKEAEMAELQARFNPHFLYNSLEMLRGKSLQAGDTVTADLITKLAALFRSIVGGSPFVRIKDELAASRRYFALMNARYGNLVQVHYDIPTDILNVGIIANSLQIIIENYFVHGFNAQKVEQNEGVLLFSGKMIDDKMMELSIEDNGSGMDEASINALNKKLESGIGSSADETKRSYGLLNLHQRLRLFYGPGCGVLVTKGKSGLCVTMRFLKMTVEEYEKKQNN